MSEEDESAKRPEGSTDLALVFEAPPTVTEETALPAVAEPAEKAAAEPAEKAAAEPAEKAAAEPAEKAAAEPAEKAAAEPAEATASTAAAESSEEPAPAPATPAAVAESPARVKSGSQIESETLYALEDADVREAIAAEREHAIPIEVEGKLTIESRPPPNLGPANYIGTTIDGRYRVESLLGEGGMGFVYRCRHKVLDRIVAIKVLRQDVPRARVVMERFVMEAKAATAIGNAHIVDVLDFGELPDGSTYFVMEYLEGRSLSEVMDRERPVPTPLILSIARQIAEGLGAAHLASIVHRDLKPDNVFLIEREGQSDFVKILDFGIAKVGSFESKITRAGEIFGTPHYMSPEQAKGASIDHRADIYALGVILFELITGHVPFDSDTPFGILTQHISADPPPVSALASKVLPGLEAIVMKCLAKKPDHRYASMEALIEELDRVERGKAPIASRELTQRALTRTLPSSIPPPFQSASRRRWPVFAIGGLLIAGAGSAVYFGTLAPQGRVAKVTADARLAFRSEMAMSSLRASAPISPAERQVALVLSPIDARVYKNGQDLGAMPVTLALRADEVSVVHVKRQGFYTRKVKIDGRKPRVIVRLAPIPGAKLKVPVPVAPADPSGGAEVETAEPADDDKTEENAVVPSSGSARPAPGKPAPGPAEPETSPPPNEDERAGQ